MEKQNKVATVDEVKTVIRKAGDQFSKVDSGLDWKKEAFYAHQMIEKNDMLKSFIRQKPQSIVDAIVNVATVGLTLNPALAYAYLVPRDGRCMLDISYRGFIKILTDSGTVRNIEAEDVYSCDHYLALKGSEPRMEFSRALSTERGELLGTFAIAYFHGGGSQWLFMDINEIKEVAKTSATYTAKFSPWRGPFEGEMRKKTVIRRLFKTLPQSKIKDNVIRALELDNETNPHNFKTSESNDLDVIFEDVQVEPDPQGGNKIKEEKADQEAPKETPKEELFDK